MKKWSDRKLESFPFFPYIAWTLVIAFAFFVYQISLDLKRTTTALEAQTGLRNNTLTTPTDVQTES